MASDETPRRGSCALHVNLDAVASRAALAYGVAGFVVMWLFWICFVIFLAGPTKLLGIWPLPTVDAGGSIAEPFVAALVDLALVALFGLQHSLMARPGLKKWWTSLIPSHLERATYVHASNCVLFLLIVFWQSIPVVLWEFEWPLARNALWAVFATGWIILLAGALSFGLYDLLGLSQIQQWRRGQGVHWLYEWVRHPMYLGVLLGVWATPRMTVGHALLASGLTLYVLVAMRYEERDLAQSFGNAYAHWRGAR